MNLEQLRHIVTLARTKSYARAARELNVSQPVLSRSIQAIEQRYGVRLFDRGRFGVSLTSTGATIIDEAEEILRRTDVFHHTMARLKQGDGGAVSLGMGPLPAAILLPELLSTLLNERPSMRSGVKVQSAPTLLKLLLSEDVEFFISGDVGLFASADVLVERIGATRTGLFVRRDHPLALIERVEPHQLAKFPAIGTSPLTEISGYDPTVSCDIQGILLEVTKRTDAVWSTSPSLVENEPEIVQLDGSLARVQSVQFSLVTLPHRKVSSLASFTIDHLRRILRNHEAKPTQGVV